VGSLKNQIKYKGGVFLGGAPDEETAAKRAEKRVKLSGLYPTKRWRKEKGSRADRGFRSILEK